jgi:tetratricopeptide (TPR) repeat protein
MGLFKIDFSEIRQSIYKLRIDEVFKSLRILQEAPVCEMRKKDHLHGILLMQRGLFSEAIEVFQEALQRHGYHISLIVDLATCYYLTGQTQNWLNSLELAEVEFRQIESQISAERRAEVLLTLGKFREEQGWLSEARTLHEKNLENCLQSEGSVEHIRALTQCLRLGSEYGAVIEMQERYKQLMHLQLRELDWDCAFEVEHALMIFEIKYFGVESGMLRWQKLIRRQEIAPQEMALLCSDICFEALMSGVQIPSIVISRFRGQIDLSCYEEAILRLAMGEVPSERETLQWSDAVSPASHLRLVELMYKLTLRPGFASEANSQVWRRKFMDLLRNLSAPSQGLWMAQLAINMSPPSEKLSKNNAMS